MTTIASPRALPDQGTSAPAAISTTADVIEPVQRSNHATAFAGWTVTAIAMGLVGAGHAASIAGGENEPTGAAADVVDAAGREPDDHESEACRARDRLWSTLTSAQAREPLARRAPARAFGSGAAFLTWSLAVILLASR